MVVRTNSPVGRAAALLASFVDALLIGIGKHGSESKAGLSRNASQRTSGPNAGTAIDARYGGVTTLLRICVGDRGSGGGRSFSPAARHRPRLPPRSCPWACPTRSRWAVNAESRFRNPQPYALSTRCDTCQPRADTVKSAAVSARTPPDGGQTHPTPCRVPPMPAVSRLGIRSLIHPPKRKAAPRKAGRPTSSNEVVSQFEWLAK